MNNVPYEVKSREFSKNHFAERRTYNCDKNGELHIRVEPLGPSESVRPATPVSPVMPTSINDLHFPKFDDDLRENKNKRPNEVNFGKMSLRIPRPKASSRQRTSDTIKDRNRNYYECVECLNELNREKSFDQSDRDEAGYSKVIPIVDEIPINNPRSSRLYSRRHEKEINLNQRARTSSPLYKAQSEFFHSPNYRRSISHNKVENPSPFSVVDSGMSSAGSSFSPSSSISSSSYLASMGPIKKITKKSRFVSIHDGRPVSPLVTKVYYEPLYSSQLLSLPDRQSVSETEFETNKIIINPLFTEDL